MNLLKVFSALWTITAFLLFLLLFWNESSVTCGITTCKVVELMFLVVAFIGYDMYKDTDWNSLNK